MRLAYSGGLDQVVLGLILYPGPMMVAAQAQQVKQIEPVTTETSSQPNLRRTLTLTASAWWTKRALGRRGKATTELGPATRQKVKLGGS